jgi:polyhydroxyalkanoate synthesis regulator phasin
MIDYQSMAKTLKSRILGESNSPSLRSYIQSISETLSKLKPTSKADQRRVEIALQHVKEVRKHARKLEERVLFLEEQVQVLEEKNLKGTNK